MLMEHYSINPKYKAKREIGTLAKQCNQCLSLANDSKSAGDWEGFGFLMYKAGEIGRNIIALLEEFNLPLTDRTKSLIGHKRQYAENAVLPHFITEKTTGTFPELKR